jgi:endo-1,4-beta-xylanase
MIRSERFASIAYIHKRTCYLLVGIFSFTVCGNSFFLLFAFVLVQTIATMPLLTPGFRYAPGGALRLRLIFALFMVAASGVRAFSDKYKQFHGIGTLRQLAKNNGKYIGSCSRIEALTDPGDPTYLTTLGAQFSLVTAENQCKFAETEPIDKNYSFTGCNTILSAAVDATQLMRGHNLVWGKLNPPWLTQSNFTSAQSATILQNHVDTVLKFYGGKAFVWDVVNEAVSDDPVLNGTFKYNDWYPQVKDYVDLAFTKAGASRANGVKLFYNDYNIASGYGLFAPKSQAVYDLLSDMRKRGIPVDGIGLQLHIDINYDLMLGVVHNLKRLAALGLTIHMTEIDVSCNAYPLPCEQWTEKEETMQAEVYAALMQACLDEPMCESFELWGFTDKYSWRGESQHPLLYNADYSPKLAVTALADTLSGNQTWVNNYYNRVNSTSSVDGGDLGAHPRANAARLSERSWVNTFHGLASI